MATQTRLAQCLKWLPKKLSLMSIRAALDTHHCSLPHSKKFSICNLVTFQWAKKHKQQATLELFDANRSVLHFSVLWQTRLRKSKGKKTMLCICVTGAGEEHFELNKDQPGTMLSSKNHTGGLEGTEDQSNGKIFSTSSSPRCPVKTITSYLSHLNPDNFALFQQPRSPSTKFDPNETMVWYKKCMAWSQLI